MAMYFAEVTVVGSDEVELDLDVKQGSKAEVVRTINAINARWPVVSGFLGTIEDGRILNMARLIRLNDRVRVIPACSGAC